MDLLLPLALAGPDLPAGWSWSAITFLNSGLCRRCRESWRRVSIVAQFTSLLATTRVRGVGPADYNQIRYRLNRHALESQ